MTVEEQQNQNPDALSEGKRIRRNYIYNLIYQIFLILVPTVITPYVARVLGDDGSGQYSFCYSLVTYFILFASLGFGFYAQRLVAKHQGDKRQQTIDFWEVILARAVPAALTLAVYLGMIFVGVYDEKYRLLMLVMVIEVAAVLFDIAFFFQGNEEFGKMVLRNVLVKTIGFASIFLFVRDAGDVWIYALIRSLTVLVSNLTLWLNLPRVLARVSVRELHPLTHIKPAFLLFLPTIATSIYTSLDKTFIGLITHSDSENGNYEYAEKLVKMALTVVTSLGAVMIPRNSRKFAEGDLDGVQRNIERSVRFVWLLGIPMALGLVAVADNLVPWFLGSGYDKAANLIKLLSPIVLLIGLSNVFGLQYLIPSGADKKYTAAVTLGAVTNMAFNGLLISFFASYGAAVATVIAEAVVTFVMLWFIRRHIRPRTVFASSWKYLIAGGIMFVPCWFLGEHLSPSVGHTLLIVAVGAVVYACLLLLLREEYVLSALRALRARFSRKKDTHDT